MVIYKCIKCEVCIAEYRVRFSVGNKFPQSATFPCKTCGELLTFGFQKNGKEILIHLTEIPDNFDLPVINLHPELPINPEFLTDPTYFPSLEFMSKQMKKGDEGFIEMRRAQASVINYQSKWDEVQQDFRLLIEQRWGLLENKYGKDQQKIERKILKKAIDTCRIFLEGKWDILFKKVLAEAEKTKRHPNFPLLKTFLQSNREDFLLKKLYAIMKEYRNVESELLPTLINQKCDLEQSGLSSSVNWPKIEKVYGDLYEVYGDLLIIPTTINNLLQRDDYTKFATPGFSLEKYIDSDKAGRYKNFSENSQLTLLSDFYDSGIRNGTHHKASNFDIENQEVIIKTGKGGKNERKMPLLDYIRYCNEIYARCLILLNIFYKLSN